MRSARALDRSGFTLLELLVSLMLAVVVVTGLSASMMNGLQTHQRRRGDARSGDALRSARMALVTALRTAEADPLGVGLGLLDPDPDGSGSFDDVRITSDFNPPDGDVADVLEDVRFWRSQDTLYASWQTSGTATPVAVGVSDLSFEYFDAGGNALTTTADVELARSVRVTISTDPIGRAPARTLAARVMLRNRTN